MRPEVLAQVFGFGALAASLIIYSRKKKSSLLLFKAVQDIFWCIHYLLLSCFSAAGTSAICVSRSFVIYHCEQKGKKSRWAMAAYLLFYGVSVFFTWQNAFSLLPVLASCTSTVAFFQKKLTHTKLLQILASCITLTYNILWSHSLTVYLGVALTVTTATVSLLKTRNQ